MRLKTGTVATITAVFEIIIVICFCSSNKMVILRKNCLPLCEKVKILYVGPGLAISKIHIIKAKFENVGLGLQNQAHHKLRQVHHTLIVVSFLQTREGIEVVDKEEAASGAVTLKSYFTYFKAGKGHFLFLFYLIVAVGAQVKYGSVYLLYAITEEASMPYAIHIFNPFLPILN